MKFYTLAGLLIVVAAFLPQILKERPPSGHDQVQVGTALVVDRGQVRDIDVLVTAGEGREVHAAAPIGSWYYAQIANGEPLSFCFQVPQGPKDVTVQALNQIWAFFDPATLPPWYETSCDEAIFQVTDTATTDCGLDNAIGCFAYYWDGAQNRYEGVISYSGVHYPSQMNLQGVFVVMAHEFGHMFSLDHTTCDWPVVSVLTAIYLPGGPTCTGAAGPVVEDYEDIQMVYPNLRFRGAAQWQPKEAYVQKWTEASKEHCPDPSGDWCILSVPLGPVQHDTWLTTAIVLPDGQVQYPGGFDHVAP